MQKKKNYVVHTPLSYNVIYLIQTITITPQDARPEPVYTIVTAPARLPQDEHPEPVYTIVIAPSRPPRDEHPEPVSQHQHACFRTRTLNL